MSHSALVIRNIKAKEHLLKTVLTHIGKKPQTALQLHDQPDVSKLCSLAGTLHIIQALLRTRLITVTNRDVMVRCFNAKVKALRTGKPFKGPECVYCRTGRYLTAKVLATMLEKKS